MRFVLLVGASLALGCGGKALLPDDTGSSNGTAGAAPIDTAALPTQLTLHCPSVGFDEVLSLPFRVGKPRVSGAHSVNTVICTDQTGLIAFNTTFPLGELATKLNQPQTIPFEGSAMDSEPVLTSEWRGTAVFSAVDPDARVFVARFSDTFAEFTVTSPPARFRCDVPNATFWGFPGNVD